MVVPHMREQVHSVRVVFNGRVLNNTKSLELVAERLFCDDELCSVGAVEAIDTVAGTEAASKRTGLGCSGMWLRVRVSGLGFLRF